MDFILSAVLVLGAIAFVAAVILYVCSKKFAVKEDPRLAVVNEALPGANCGGCGFPGCSGMADALVKAADKGSLEGLNCPVGGADTMAKVADLLGMAIANAEPKVAVVRCNGTCELRPRIVRYDGLLTCTAMNATGAGETGCGWDAWVVAIVSAPVSLMPSASTTKQDSLKLTRRSVRHAVPA